METISLDPLVMIGARDCQSAHEIVLRRVKRRVE